MSVAALVDRVSEVLGRAHALFGDTPAVMGPSSRLAGVPDLVRGARDSMAGLSGDFACGYGDFASGAGAALDGLAGADDRLGSGVGEASGADRGGRADSRAVVGAAAADTAALGPATNTAAGERALIAALRARVAEQQRVVAAYRLRDARLATLLRSLIYARVGAMGGGGVQMRHGGGGLRWPAPVVPPLGAASRPAQHARLVGRAAPAREVPAGPGAAAAEAALSRIGCPYVWGAAGPSTFDCSGLAQWSWGKAGVRLGRDTYTQITEGVPVAPGDVRAGDLIFPTSAFDEDGRPGPGHVQLAISPTHVVEAPHTGASVQAVPMPASFVARRPTPD